MSKEKRTICVKGLAKASAKPDTVVLSFEVHANNMDYSQSIDELNYRTNTLREELESIGLERGNLKTAEFNIRAEYVYNKKDEKVFDGYKANHDLKIEFPMDKDMLNKVLNKLGKTQSKTMFSINFDIKDKEPFLIKALHNAVKNARQRAELLAAASGVQLGKVLEINYNWGEIHVYDSGGPMGMLLDAEANYDITPDDIDLQDTVTLIWEIE